MRIFEIYKKYQEVFRYLIFGVFTTILSLAIYYALTFTILNPHHSIELQCANILSWIAGVLFAYVTNRKYVFNSQNQKKGKEFIKFAGGRVFTLLVDILIMFLGVTVLKYNDRVIKLISQVFIIVLNYILSKFLVFQR